MSKGGHSPAPSPLAPPKITGLPRYDWQIMCGALALADAQHDGLVLNVGCNEDPARLRARFGARIVNCDMEAWDQHMDRPNLTDRVFNCLDIPWPCESDEADMVILGDILEHFTEHAMIDVLTEAARVARRVGVTVPEDTRIDQAAEQAKWKPDAYNLHTTIVTREIVTRVFKAAGLRITHLHEAEWGFDQITGWCVIAERTR